MFLKKSAKILRIGIIPATLFCLMLILQPLKLTMLSLLAATVHECGHLLAAHLLNIPLRSLCISTMGATIRIRGSLISYKKEWLLCAGGPLANFLCAFFTYIALQLGGSESEGGWWFVAVSVMLGALNLLLAEGFDGGRMLYASVASLLGVRAAERTLAVTSFISIVFLWMISVYLLIRYKTSLTLFVFTISLFYRLFLSSDN